MYELKPSSCCASTVAIALVLFDSAFICRVNTLTSSTVEVPNKLFERSPIKGSRERQLHDLLISASGISFLIVSIVLFNLADVSDLTAFILANMCAIRRHAELSL